MIGTEVKAPSSINDTEQFATPSSVWRLRTDAWEYLGYAAKQLPSLTNSDSDSNPVEKGLLAEVRRQLRVLESVET